MGKNIFSGLLFFSLMVCVGKRHWNYSVLYYLTSGAGPAPSPGGNVRPACINAEDTVQTPIGTKRIDQLSLGDQVAVEKRKNSLVFEQVVSFIHRDKSKSARGFRFTMSSGRHVSLSEEHLVLLAPGRKAVFAKKVRVGQSMFTSVDGSGDYHKEKIVKMEPMALKGLYSPLTKSGTLLINDILVSCYSHAEDHNLMHFITHYILTLVGYDQSFETDGFWGRQDGLHAIISPIWHFFRRYFVGSA